MIVVCDTSPLRALQAVERLDLISHLYGRALIPPAVVAELAVHTRHLAPLSVSAVMGLEVRQPTVESLVRLGPLSLGRGETDALALALDVRAELVLLDDLPARKAALRLGLKPTGVLAMLGQAKGAGLVDAVEPLLCRLEVAIRFRIGKELRTRLLRDVGESG